jgi:hypothetical protein
VSRTALYRHFDAAGSLLYVGISLSAVQRLGQHRNRAGWYSQIVRVSIEWLPDRATALAAEAFAIATEAPAHNRKRPGVIRRKGNFAIEHVPTGRRDGNYFDEFDAREMLSYWSSEYPSDSFRLVSAVGGRPGGAAAFAPRLRPFEAHIWSVARTRAS